MMCGLGEALANVARIGRERNPQTADRRFPNFVSLNPGQARRYSPVIDI
jgi:hypothetical protein